MLPKKNRYFDFVKQKSSPSEKVEIKIILNHYLLRGPILARPHLPQL